MFFLLSDSSDIVLFHYFLPFDRLVGACPSQRQSG